MPKVKKSAAPKTPRAPRAPKLPEVQLVALQGFDPDVLNRIAAALERLQVVLPAVRSVQRPAVAEETAPKAKLKVETTTTTPVPPKAAGTTSSLFDNAPVCPACSTPLDKENSSKSPTTGKLTHVGCKVVQGPSGKKVEPEPVAEEEAPAEEVEVINVVAKRAAKQAAAPAPAFEDLRQAAVAFVGAQGKPALMELLNAEGCTKLSEVPEEKRAALLASMSVEE